MAEEAVSEPEAASVPDEAPEPEVTLAEVAEVPDAASEVCTAAGVDDPAEACAAMVASGFEFETGQAQVYVPGVPGAVELLMTDATTPSGTLTPPARRLLNSAVAAVRSVSDLNLSDAGPVIGLSPRSKTE